MTFKLLWDARTQWSEWNGKGDGDGEFPAHEEGEEKKKLFHQFKISLVEQSHPSICPNNKTLARSLARSHSSSPTRHCSIEWAEKGDGGVE